MRRILIAMPLAIVATVVLFFANQSPGRHWFDIVLVAPLLLAGWASSNLHQPDEVLFWAMAFLMIWVLGIALVWIVEKWRAAGQETS